MSFGVSAARTTARAILVPSLCLALLLVPVRPVPAQDAPPEFELPDVISPGRRPQRAATSPASVSVLTAAELRRLGVRTVGEAIAFLPETLARAYGGPGGLITASVRGSSAEQVLVLLDGVPINGAAFGTVDLSTIPIDGVERIEVLRGPFSAIYGSGALGGVISIVTARRGARTVTAGGGSFGAVGIAISGGGDARITLRYDRADGARPNSDLRSGTLSLRFGETSGPRAWDMSVFGSMAARGAPGTTFFPSLQARQDDHRLVAAYTLQRTSGAASDRVRLSLHREGIEFRDPSFGFSDRTVGTTWSGEWQRVLRLSPVRATTLGVDVRAPRISSLSIGGHSGVVAAAYAQDDRAVTSRLFISTGLRVDWQSTYDVQVNPRLGFVYFIRPDLRLRLAAGRAFRGPTFADLYYPFDGFVVGNPALRPEQAWSIDLGLEGRARGGLVTRATAFWSDVRDLIIYVPDAFLVFSPQNVGSASIRGASIEAEGPLAPRWSVRASATWLQATDLATGLDLPNRPRHSGAVSLSHRIGTATLSASVVLVGARYADVANTVTLPGYASVGFVVDAPLADGLVARATVSNLFDARYESVQGYPAPGRTVLFEVALRR
jgi:outer membrane cobalamin receptor